MENSIEKNKSVTDKFFNVFEKIFGVYLFIIIALGFLFPFFSKIDLFPLILTLIVLYIIGKNEEKARDIIKNFDIIIAIVFLIAIVEMLIGIYNILT